MKLNKKAFTLIELLVVIAIIGILATISVLALQNARAKSRDAKRVADVAQIKTALELYFNDMNRYPTTAEFNAGLFSTSTLGTTTYMANIPSAPTPADGTCDTNNNSFSYTQTEEGASYVLSFCIGGNTGDLDPGLHAQTPVGINSCVGACFCEADCSNKTCGSDGCGGSCGACVGDDSCVSNNCFSPADVSNLFSWYDASGMVSNTDNIYGTVNSSNAITNWKDKSGNGRNLSGNYNWVNPIFNPSLSYFNNKSGAVFAGNDKSNYATPSLISSPLTIFAVYHQLVGTTGDRIVALSNAYSTGDGGYYLGYGNTDGKMYFTDQTGAGISVSAPAVPFSSIISAVANGSNSKLYLNGSLGGTGTLGSFSAGGTTLGADGWSQLLDGAIAEVIIYNSALSDSDREAIETYLNNKYNIY